MAGIRIALWCAVVLICIVAAVFVRLWAPLLIDSWRYRRRRTIRIASTEVGDGPLATAEIEGNCRVCGCTEDRACEIDVTEDGPYRVCGWANEQRTLCDNPKCLAIDAARRAFEPNPDHTDAGGMRRSIHRSHRGEGYPFVD